MREKDATRSMISSQNTESCIQSRKPEDKQCHKMSLISCSARLQSASEMTKLDH